MGLTTTGGVNTPEVFLCGGGGVVWVSQHLCFECVADVSLMCAWWWQVTKKITLKMKCEKCSSLKMKNLGRCKHFELGAEKKKKGPTIHGR